MEFIIYHGAAYSWTRWRPLWSGPQKAASPLGSEGKQGLPVVSVSIAFCGEDSGQI